MAQLGFAGNGDDDDGDGPNNPNTGNNSNELTGRNNYNRRTEFALVNPRNITTNPFSGKNLHSNPYIPFNSAIRRLILSQGSDGTLLLKLLDKIEALGAT